MCQHDTTCPSLEQHVFKFLMMGYAEIFFSSFTNRAEYSVALQKGFYFLLINVS